MHTYKKTMTALILLFFFYNPYLCLELPKQNHSLIN